MRLATTGCSPIRDKATASTADHVSQNDRAASIALRWVGTPYRHQASRCGVGCDCLGLVRGVWREIYGDEPAPTPAYTPDWSEPTGDERLWRAAAAVMRPRDLAEASAGDVVLFRMRACGPAKHLGVLTEPDAMAHAHTRRGVVLTAYGAAWRSRAVAAFSWP